jgi:hypothetical protein
MFSLPVDTVHDSLAVSFQNFVQYPENLVASREFPHAREAYAKRLDENAPEVFQQSDPSLVGCLDLEADGNGAYPRTHHNDAPSPVVEPQLTQI